MQNSIESLLGGVLQETHERESTETTGLLAPLWSEEESRKEGEDAAEKIWNNAIASAARPSSQGN
jgi:hypothetical protein